MSEISPSDIGARAKEVRLDKGLQQQAIADLLGMSLRAWQKMERGEGTPSGETLLLFAKVGVNPGWLLSGLGPKLLAEDESYLYQKNAVVDADLLLDIKEIIARFHKEGGIILKANDLDRKAVEHYNEYMLDDTDMSDLEEVTLWLRMLEKRIKREVAAAAADPGSGKLAAS